MKKFVRYLIIVLIAFLLLIIAFMFLAPKNMYFKVSESIEAPPHMIYNLVNDLEKWTQWSPVNELDENTVHRFSDNTVGEGARWNWKGNEDVGEGSRKIVNSVPGESIRTEIEIAGWDNLSHGQWYFEKDGDETNVSWAFEGGNTSFVFRPFNVLYKGGIKKSYKNALENLKEIAEKRAQERIYMGFQIMDEVIDEKHYLINRQEIKIENIQQFYTQNLGALFIKVQETGLTMDGMPSGLFFSEMKDEKVLDMAAAIPVKEDKNVSGVHSLNMPESRVVQVNYYGDYSGTYKAHEAINEYLLDYNLFHKYPVIEEYVTDPGEVEDPSKWLTRISYYIAEN